MRFALVAATLVAAVVADKTVYATTDITISSCAPTVTDCPYQSTTVSPVASQTNAGEASYPAETYPVSAAPSAPGYANSTVPSYPASTPAATYPVSSPAAPYPVEPSSAAGVPSYSLSTQTFTTCVPTVIESTYTVYPSAGGTGGVIPAPSGTGVSTGVVPAPTNGTVPSYTASPPPPSSNGASGLQASFGLAVAAAVAAFFM